MLTIRQAQLVVLSQLEVEKFEDWMLAHLRKFFPKQCAALGERPLYELIRHGIERSARYGITTRRDVCKYIDLVIVFGRDFDTDKRSPWAADILRRRADSGVKMQILLHTAKLRLKNR
jgi:hypothetical protein